MPKNIIKKISESKYLEKISLKYRQFIGEQFDLVSGLKKRLENSRVIFEESQELQRYENFKKLITENMINQNKFQIGQVPVEIKAFTNLMCEFIEMGQEKIIFDIVVNYLGEDFKYLYKTKEVDISQLSYIIGNPKIIEFSLDLKYGHSTYKVPDTDLEIEQKKLYMLYYELKNLNLRDLTENELLEAVDILLTSKPQLNITEIRKKYLTLIMGNALGDSFLKSEEKLKSKFYSNLFNKKLLSEIKRSKINIEKIRNMSHEEWFDPKFLDEKSCNGLHYAGWRGHTAILCFLVNGDNINKKDKFGVTPVMYAALKYQEKTVLALVELGANLTIPNIYGETVAHYVASYDQVKLLDALLKKDKNLIHARTKEGYSPFHKSATYGAINSIKYLLDLGENINSMVHDKSTALHIAARRGHFEIYNYLIERGADRNIRNSFGKKAGDYDPRFTAYSRRGVVDALSR